MTQKAKMLTCTCGNTELDKIAVCLPLTENGATLNLVALICGGNGCGRVTFRPDDVSRKGTAPHHDSEWLNSLLGLFETVYTERMVYKVLAERDPNCAALFTALKSDPSISAGISQTFQPLHERIAKNEDLLHLLRGLPSLASAHPHSTAEEPA